MFFERLKDLCDKNELKVTPLVIKLGMSPGSIKNWQNGSSPTGDTLIKFVNYFNVSADYLLELTDMPQKYEYDMSFEELKIIQAYRNRPEMQEAVKTLLGIETPDHELNKKMPDNRVS